LKIFWPGILVTFPKFAFLRLECSMTSQRQLHCVLKYHVLISGKVIHYNRLQHLIALHFSFMNMKCIGEDM
jgi:hypothetical protein